MTISEFKQQVDNNGKLFVQLKGGAINDFMLSESTIDGDTFRTLADRNGVLVFLDDIHRIYAKGRYYGCDPDAFDTVASNLSSLQTNFGLLSENVQTLVGKVTTAEGNIADLQDLTTEQGEDISAQATQITGILSDISDLQDAVSTLTPGGMTIGEAIENKLYTLLGFRMNNPEDVQNPNTWNNPSGVTFTQAVTNLMQQASDLANDIDAVDAKVDSLTQTVSGIPKFKIEVVNSLPVSNIKEDTIYLVRTTDSNGNPIGDANDNELYTEYIYINKGTEQNPNYAWEKLGRQYFNIDNYLDEDQIKAITDPLEDYIDSIKNSINAQTAAQVEQNADDIKDLQNDLSDLQTLIEILLDSNQVFKLTGKDINTSDEQNSNTIYTDITNLQSSVTDLESRISWYVVDESSQQSQQNNNEEP